ncbi:uncharacterized protein ACBR49_013689 [Aulostomus maculatus]
MVSIENAGCDLNGELSIRQEDLDELARPNEQPRQKVSLSTMMPSQHPRLTVVSLAVLAVILLIIDISLGIHYNRLKSSLLGLKDREHVNNELTQLQYSYKLALGNTTSAKQQLATEQDLQTPTHWELEHQTKRAKDYEEQIAKTQAQIESLKARLPMIHGGCKHCPPGWILMNSKCFYFSFSDQHLSWQNAREYCMLQGGDLVVVDTSEKQNAMVDHLKGDPESVRSMAGYWMGLRDHHEEGTWRWLDGTVLVEGFWNEGEPNDINDEDCGAVYPRENYFKSWNDVRCRSFMNWICEKTPVI